MVLLVILVIISFLNFMSFSGVLPAPQSKPVKYEYKKINLSDQEFEGKMKEAGDEGWELVASHRIIAEGGKTSGFECILKRPGQK